MDLPAQVTVNTASHSSGSETLIVRVDQPVEGIDFNVHTLLRGTDGGLITPTSRKVECRWFRSKSRRGCSFENCPNSNRIATIQNLQNGLRYCSNQCFQSAFHNKNKKSSKSSSNSILVTIDEKDRKFISVEPFQEENGWEIISNEKTYVPSKEDVGYILRVECRAVTPDGRISAVANSKETPIVVGLPKPAPPRSLFTNPDSAKLRHQMGMKFDSSKVRILSYNVLADIYATKQLYPYCPMWALSWRVRRKILLREILAYDADIICLQEVQQDHYTEFFYKELEGLGYQGLYKAKTRVAGKIDGCYTLYKKERFRLVESNTIEFNSVARAIARTNAFEQRNDALRRLLKDNVAQIIVLERLDGDMSHTQGGNTLCLANTHIFWDPEYSDVKLWQTHLLLQELERVVRNRKNIPLIFCGDFNSMPSEAVVELLKSEKVSETTKPNDPCNILPPVQSITHSLGLISAYEHVTGNEPRFTNYTGHYVGTLDYIWVSRDSVLPVSTLLIPNEKTLRGTDDTPLPNTRFPSDHLALCVEVEISPTNAQAQTLSMNQYQMQ